MTSLVPRDLPASGFAMIVGGGRKACSTSGFCGGLGPWADRRKACCRHAAQWRLDVGWACGDACSSVWGSWGGACLVAGMGRLPLEMYSGKGVRDGRGRVSLVGAEFCGRPVEAWWNGRVEAGWNGRVEAKSKANGNPMDGQV